MIKNNKYTYILSVVLLAIILTSCSRGQYPSGNNENYSAKKSKSRRGSYPPVNSGTPTSKTSRVSRSTREMSINSHKRVKKYRVKRRSSGVGLLR